jgi:pimeloyl-ACP methyl ester carboxylesterase
MLTDTLPVGYHALHPDASLNFQMNRWFSWVGEPEMLEELRHASARIRSYADWKLEFVKLAELAQAQGHLLRAAFHWRSADFFMFPDDPDRPRARQRFLELVRAVYPIPPSDRAQVPFGIGDRHGSLTAITLRAKRPALDTIVFFGGFDSYIEELLPALTWLRDAGFDVIAFEGPGQGSTLHDSGLPMTPDWHLPVRAVLDHFDVAECTLAGLSLGGCLVIRAAAREPRVRRVIAYDILTDFFEVIFRQAHPAVRAAVRALLSARAAPAVNLLAGLASRRSPVMQWGLAQGMSVTGTRSPYEFLRETRRYRTADVSHLLDQDVLLLAGAADHFVPLRQLADQVLSLTAARSVTARVFTQAESAANHCQVGNYRLALEVVVDWLRASSKGKPSPS